MNRLTRLAAMAATLFLLGGAVTWLWGQSISHRNRGVVCERPIHFQDGFAVEQSFTVQVPGTHFLAIGYEKDTTVDTRLANPLSGDEFSAAFRVSAEGVIVAEGTAVNPTFVILRKGYTTRVLAGFKAEPGKSYDLALRILQPASNLVSTNPTMLILANPEIAQAGAFTQIITTNYAIVLTLIAALFSIPPLRFYVHRLQTKEHKRAPVVAS